PLEEVTSEVSTAPRGACPPAGVCPTHPHTLHFRKGLSRSLWLGVSTPDRLTSTREKRVGVLELLCWTPEFYKSCLLETFSRASYYQLALEQLHSHPEALEALGTPLNVHYLRLTDKYNFVDIADAKLKIPVSGPKSEGHLYVSSSRDAPFKRWNLQEVFLELKDGQQIPLFKPSRDNDEVKKE
uniref:Cytochrome c oxidase assembly factor 1 n=1 Tax=Bos taurus TaxID=9913 RepID=A0AAA9S1S3_BOVIN